MDIFVKIQNIDFFLNEFKNQTQMNNLSLILKIWTYSTNSSL